MAVWQSGFAHLSSSPASAFARIYSYYLPRYRYPLAHVHETALFCAPIPAHMRISNNSRSASCSHT